MVSVDKIVCFDVFEWFCLEGRRGSVIFLGLYEFKLLKCMVFVNFRGCVFLLFVIIYLSFMMI